MQTANIKESEKLHKFPPNLPENRSIKYSSFNTCKDTYPKPKNGTWDDLADICRTPAIRADKDGKAFCPATFDGHRSNKNAVECGFMAFDLDDLPEDVTAADVLACVSGLLAFAYSSHNHLLPGKGARFRVIVGVDSPIPANQYTGMVRAFSNRFPWKVDEKCFNSSRLFYFPSCAADRVELFEFERQEGALFDWCAVVDTNIAHQMIKPLKSASNPFEGMPSNLDEPVDRAKLAEALEFIVPDEYGTWLKVGMGLRELHETGFLIWDKWSAKSDKYPGRGELLKKWEGFKPGGGVGFGTIFYLAKQNGFVINPPVNVPAPTGTGLHREAIEIPQVFTELSVAGAVRQAFGNKVCYVPQTAKWHAIDEFNVWRVDLSGQVNRYVFEIIKEAKKHACSLIMAGKDDAGKALLRDITKAEKNGFVIGVVSLMRSLDGMTINSSHFDSDPLLVGLAGGQVLDLRTSTVRAMRPEDHISKTLGTCFDAAATCPRWVQFIDEVTCGDKELAMYLQVLSGYVLSGLNELHVFWLLFGSGRNGKSIFLNVLLALLSDYAVMLPSEAITLAKNGNDNSSDIARLDGARLALTNEIAEGQHYHENRIKQLTGGDKITGRLLYAEPFDFFNCAKLLQGANYKPIVKGTDAAIWDRLQLVPFRAYFPNPDRQLAEKLKLELPGVLNWAIDGWKIYQSKGLEIPSAVANESKAYKQEQDLTGQFLEQTCAVAVGNKVKSSELYTRFRMWCQDNGFYVPNSSAFGRRVANRLKSKREAAGVFYLDVKIVGLM